MITSYMRMFKNFIPACLLCCGAAALTACVNDDTDFSAYINEQATTASNDTIRIAYSGTTATVSGDSHGIVSVSGADVTVNDPTSTSTMVLVLSGTTTNGSLLVYRSLKYEVVLNGVSITNANGPAINNQCGKAFHLTLANGTVNSLTDGTAYAEQSYDQKGTLFSEGQIYVEGTGTLNVNGNGKNGIASDDYITFRSGTVNVNVAATGSNGVKVNDGFTIEGGTLNIDVSADGARGIRNGARTIIAGGNATITTSGGCSIETIDGIVDTTSCAGIKSDSLFTMTAGTLTITSTGDGGKGINCSENIELSGGTLTVTTTGDNVLGKPKALKSDTGIIVSGGSLTARVEKSWACDNGTDSDEPEDHITIIGTPLTPPTLTKKLVKVVF
jgi:hypothetical protein